MFQITGTEKHILVLDEQHGRAWYWSTESMKLNGKEVLVRPTGIYTNSFLTSLCCIAGVLPKRQTWCLASTSSTSVIAWSILKKPSVKFRTVLWLGVRGVYANYNLPICYAVGSRRIHEITLSGIPTNPDEESPPCVEKSTPTRGKVLSLCADKENVAISTEPGIDYFKTQFGICEIGKGNLKTMNGKAINTGVIGHNLSISKVVPSYGNDFALLNDGTVHKLNYGGMKSEKIRMPEKIVDIFRVGKYRFFLTVDQELYITSCYYPRAYFRNYLYLPDIYKVKTLNADFFR